jgi:hypothetical protein
MFGQYGQMYIKKIYYANYTLVKMIFPWRWDRIRLLTVFDLNQMGSVHRMPKLWGFYKEILKLMHCCHPPRLLTRPFHVKIYMPIFAPIRHQSSMGSKKGFQLFYLKQLLISFMYCEQWYVSYLQMCPLQIPGHCKCWIFSVPWMSLDSVEFVGSLPFSWF